MITILRKIIKSDISAEFFDRVRRVKMFLVHYYYTKSVCIIAKLKGVKLGVNMTFNGIVHFDRFKFSSIEIGNNCTFNSCYLFNQFIDNNCIVRTNRIGSKIKIGDSSGFSGVKIICDSLIQIGNNVVVGANTTFRDGDDHEDITKTSPKPIVIEDNVFIGRNCSILKGVHIGRNTIIGAGSIVTKGIPANCVAAGVPCKVIRRND